MSFFRLLAIPGSPDRADVTVRNACTALRLAVGTMAGARGEAMLDETSFRSIVSCLSVVFKAPMPAADEVRRWTDASRRLGDGRSGGGANNNQGVPQLPDQPLDAGLLGATREPQVEAGVIYGYEHVGRIGGQPRRRLGQCGVYVDEKRPQKISSNKSREDDEKRGYSRRGDL